LSSASQIIRRRRKRQDRHAAASTRSRLWTVFLITAVMLVSVVPAAVILGGAGVIYLQQVSAMRQPQETVSVTALIGPTRLYDRSGQTLLFSVEDPLGDDRQWLTLDELPPYIAQATLLVEDPNFLQMAGFNFPQTTTRLWYNLLSGPLDADTSLTGRLVRNAIAPPPDFVRVEDRARETVLIAEANRLYTPEQILEWHLNTNYYGNEAYGIDAAARVYLGKSARELTVDETALLVSIPTAPQFNPIDDEVAARGRQSDTLRRMLVEEIITQAQYDDASRMQTVLLPNAGQIPEIAPEYSLYARQQAESILDNLGLDGDQLISRSGLKIITTLDLDLYYQSECVLRAHLGRLQGQPTDVRALNGASCDAMFALPLVEAVQNPPDTGQIVILDATTGELKAIVGAVNNQHYQPGPALYPFVYFEGFRTQQQGIIYTPATMVLDIPRRFPGAAENLIYTPSNPDNRFSGPINLREAAAKGLLPPVVQIASSHSMNNILQSAHRMGLNSLLGIYHLSLLERGGEVSLLDLSYAYSVFASMGDMYGVQTTPRSVGFRIRNPVAVLRIEDAHGRVLWEYNSTANRTNVFSSYPELGYLVNDLFSDTELRREKFGDPNPLTLSSRTAAVINGLTSDNADNWTIGYTPQRVVGVHLGREDFSETGLSSYALEGAASVWQALMEYSHRELPAAEWPRPENIVDGTVCQRSGLLPNGICPTRREIFINGIIPTQTDSYWVSVTINSQTRTRATVNTPENLRVSQTYFVPPDNALEWWIANNLELPPTETDIFSVPENSVFRSTKILQPEKFAFVRGQVEIRGVVNTVGMRQFELAYGAGTPPQEWFKIGEPHTTFNPDDDLLAVWDTTGLDAPFYTIELSVLLQNGTRERDFVQVRVDNTPPTVILSAGEPGKIYRWPDETIIRVQAQVNDNFAIDRVEFYHNGRLVDEVTQAPYVHAFGITRTGTEFFRAIAYDAAGNRQESTEIRVEVTR
jgi:membrane peptidoglycan carboxypeptidase